MRYALFAAVFAFLSMDCDKFWGTSGSSAPPVPMPRPAPVDPYEAPPAIVGSAFRVQPPPGFVGARASGLPGDGWRVTTRDGHTVAEIDARTAPPPHPPLEGAADATFSGKPSRRVEGTADWTTEPVTIDDVTTTTGWTLRITRTAEGAWLDGNLTSH